MNYCSFSSSSAAAVVIFFLRFALFKSFINFKFTMTNQNITTDGFKTNGRLSRIQKKCISIAAHTKTWNTQYSWISLDCTISRLDVCLQCAIHFNSVSDLIRFHLPIEMYIDFKSVCVCVLGIHQCLSFIFCSHATIEEWEKHEEREWEWEVAREEEGGGRRREVRRLP